MRQRGIQSTEKMLRKDSIITAIGELSRSKTKSDNFILQPPLNGSPFYITSMSITSLIRKLDDRKKIYRHVNSSRNRILFVIISRNRLYLYEIFETGYFI